MKKNKKDENKKEVKKEKKVKLNKKVFIPFISLEVLSFIAYIIIEVLYNNNLLSSIGSMIGIGIIFLFTICFVIISLKSDNKKSIPFIIIGFLLIILYSGFNIFSAK